MTVVLIVIAVILILLLVGGYVASRKRAENWRENVASAERELERAFAADKGWDRELLQRSARDALGSHRPGWEYSDVYLVDVVDKPGVEHDHAHLVAVGQDGEARVVLAREADGGWRVESVS